MRSMAYFFLTLLLCVILVGGVFIVGQGGEGLPSLSQSESVADSLEESQNDSISMEKPNSGMDDTESNDEDSSNKDDGSTVINTELKDPVNVSAFIADGMEMLSGAALYSGGDEDIAPAIRFTCLVETALAEEIISDEDKSMAILVAPLDDFEEVNENNYTYIDWVTALENADKDFVLTELDTYGAYDTDTSFIRFTLTNIMYKNINRKFVAIGVVIDNTGAKPSYKYSSFAKGIDYRTNARSIAYLAAASLNAHTLGLETFGDAQLETFKCYINASVDQANGKAESTNDGSMYQFKVSQSNTKRLSIGEYFTIETTILPNVSVPVWYRSSDKSVVEVDDNGVVTAKGRGTAVIGVYVAGESLGVTVTVS